MQDRKERHVELDILVHTVAIVLFSWAAITWLHIHGLIILWVCGHDECCDVREDKIVKAGNLKSSLIKM